MAKDYLIKDDTILLESDLIYDEHIIKKLVDSKYANAAVVAKHEDWMDGTVVTIDEEDNIIEFIEKSDFDYSKKDEDIYLIFGRESSGIDKKILKNNINNTISLFFTNLKSNQKFRFHIP